jgi:putative membrane protein
MNLIIRLLITSGLVLLLSYLLPGIGVKSFSTAIVVAIILGLLNTFLKPVLVFFTLPVTVITLGLFLLVINAVIVLLCEKIVDGFSVSSFWTALLFSVLLSISQSIVYKLTSSD